MKQPIEQNDASEPKNSNKGPKNTPAPGPAPGKSAADVRREEAEHHVSHDARNQGAAVDRDAIKRNEMETHQTSRPGGEDMSGRRETQIEKHLREAPHVGEIGQSGEPVAQDSVTVEPHPVRQPSGKGPGAATDAGGQESASDSALVAGRRLEREPDYYQLDYLKRGGDRLPWELHSEHWPTQAEAEERRAGFDKDHASVRITPRHWDW